MLILSRQIEFYNIVFTTTNLKVLKRWIYRQNCKTNQIEKIDNLKICGVFPLLINKKFN